MDKKTKEFLKVLAIVTVVAMIIGVIVGWFIAPSFEARASETLVCPTGEHATSTLVSEAVPAVAEVSHVVTHEAVYDVDGVTVITPAWDETIIDTPAVPEVPAVYAESCEADVVPMVEQGGAGACMNCNGEVFRSYKEEEETVDISYVLEQLKALDPALYEVIEIIIR